MLDKSSKAPANTSSMKIGDLRFIPGTGICIYSGNENIEYGGVAENYYVLTPINKLESTIRKPSSKWNDVDFPTVADYKKIQEIFKALAAPKKEKRGVWSRVEKGFRTKMSNPDLKETAEVVHLILSKHRRPKPRKEKDVYYEVGPSEANLSYSHNVVLRDALDILVPVLEFRCGLEAEVARDMLIRTAVQTGYIGHKKLSDKAGQNTGLNATEFQNIFGQKRRVAATVVDGGAITYMPPSNDQPKRRRPTQADYDQADAIERASDMRAAQIKKEKQKKTRERANDRARARRKASSQNSGDKKSIRRKGASSHRRTRRFLPILPHNQEAYAELKNQLPETPTVLAVFNLAAGVIKNADNLKIAARLWLVSRENRVAHEQMRTELNLSEGDYLERIRIIKQDIEDAAERKNLKSISRVSLSVPKKLRKKRSGSHRTKTMVISPEMQKAKDIFKVRSSRDPSHKSVFNLAARTYKYQAELAAATSLWLASPEHRMTHEEVREKLGLSEKKYDKFVKDIFEKIKVAACEENLRAFTRVKFDFSDAQRRMGNSMTYSIDESKTTSLAQGPC